MKKLLYLVSAIIMLSVCHIPCYANGITELGQPDSIVYLLNDLGKTRKNVFQYNNNLLSSTTIYEQNSLNSGWIPLEQTQISTNAGIQSSIIKTYNESESAYINSFRNDIKIDSRGYRTLEAYYTWNALNSMWKGFRTKIERTYTDSGAISSFANSAWDSISNSWKVYTLGTMQLTSFGKPEYIYYSAPNEAGESIYTSRIEYSYLPNFKTEYETTSNFNSGTSTFTPVFRNHFEYSASAPQYKETIELFDVAKQVWSPTQKTETSFDLNGNLSRQTVADLDTTNNEWIERYRHEINILNNSLDSINITQTDAPGGITRYIKQYKQTTDANGIITGKSSISQDNILLNSEEQKMNFQAGSLSSLSNYNAIENIKLEWKYNSTDNTLSCNNYTIDQKSKAENLIRSSIIYFSNNQTEIPTVKSENRLTFWPNPATNVLNIENKGNKKVTYSIFSMDGKSILSGVTLNQITPVNLNTMQSGTYLIQLKSESNKAITRVFIKQ